MLQNVAARSSGVPKSVELNREQFRAGPLNNSTKEVCDEKITKKHDGLI
jgi:hypothetical protein